MTARKSLIATLFLVCLLFLYVVPQFIQLSVVLGSVLLGGAMVLQEKIMYRVAMLIIGAISFSIVLVGQITPFTYLVNHGVSFAIALLLTVMLLAVIVTFTLFLPRMIAGAITRYVR